MNKYGMSFVQMTDTPLSLLFTSPSFVMFSIAYMKYAREEKTVGGKWKSQSLKVIAVGSCPVSNSLLFYHPPTRQLLSCGDGHRLDTSSPSGPQFKEIYENNFIFNFNFDDKMKNLLNSLNFVENQSALLYS